MRVRGHRAKIIVGSATALVGVGLSAGCAPQRQLEPARPCTATLVSLTAPVLADGRAVYVEPVAVGYAASRLMVLGDPVLLDDGQVVTRASAGGQPVAGVLLDSAGRAILVPSPDADSTLVGVRIVSTAGDAWSVTWDRITRPISRSLAAATLTQSTFAGERWSAPIEVTHFEEALLDPGLSSVAAPLRNGLALALPIRQATARGAVSVLAREHGSWRRSDVPLTRNALYTSFISYGERWVIAYVGSDTLKTGIFVASSGNHGDTWSPPIRTPVEQGYSVQLLNEREGLALLFLGEGRPLKPRGLRVMFSTDGLVWSTPLSVPHTDSTVAYSAVPLSSTAAVVFRQDGDAQRRVHSIGLLGRQSIRWLRTDTVDAISKPLITRGRANEFYAVWAAAEMSAGNPKPRLRVARYRLSCDGAE